MQVDQVNTDVKYIRPQDVARLYSISVKMVYRAIWDGDLPARKIAQKVWLITPDDAQKWIETLFARMEQAG